MIGLDELATAPERARDLSDDECEALVFRNQAVGAALARRRELRTESANNGNGNGAVHARLIGIKEAAKSVGLSVSHLYRHFDELGGVKVGRRVMFSPEDLDTRIKILRARRR